MRSTVVWTVLCNCGHRAVPDGSTTGYGIDQWGYTWCFPCCDANEVQNLRHSHVIAAYVREADRTIRTFGGGLLGQVTALSVGARRYTPSGGMFRMRHVQMRDVHGQAWIGKSSDSGNLVYLRKVRSRGSK